MAVPPKGVQEAAARAVRWIEEGRAGKNFTDVAALARTSLLTARTSATTS